MPGVPPHKNRTDHGVASCSSVSDVVRHTRTNTQVLAKIIIIIIHTAIRDASITTQSAMIST